ncbi:MAG: HNH endonuclease, partial [Bryobacteraceae bacterium]
LARLVRERAREQCEYCRLPQSAFPFSFQVDHIRAEKHGGETVESNLALACPHCNRHKGPNSAGVDPSSGQLNWSGSFIPGRTAGRSILNGRGPTWSGKH